MVKEVNGEFLEQAGWPKEMVSTFSTKSSDCVVSVRGVSKRFGSRLVLDKVSFDVKKGEIFGILGMSGAGKTTLLHSLVGFVEPDAGDVVVVKDGAELSLSESPEEVKGVIGFSSQHASVYGKLTALENVEHFAALYGVSDVKRKVIAERLLKLVGLDGMKDQLAQELSGGMQKRLDIACALVHDPSVIVFDEPGTDLDPLHRKEVWSLLQRIQKLGKTVIVASHFMGDMERVCSRIGILRDRTLKDVGTVAELCAKGGSEFVVNVRTRYGKAKSLAAEVQKRLNVVGRVHGLEVRFSTKSPNGVVNMILAAATSCGEEVVQLSVRKPNLSEVFEKLVRS